MSEACTFFGGERVRGKGVWRRSVLQPSRWWSGAAAESVAVLTAVAAATEVMDLRSAAEYGAAAVEDGPQVASAPGPAVEEPVSEAVGRFFGCTTPCRLFELMPLQPHFG